MPSAPAFSVVIPTRERADVLHAALRTVVSQDYENLQIIVCDNFSADNTREVVESFADRRIAYVNPGRRLSMSHNWEFALSHVRSEWVTVLGDDDGLLPGALQKVVGIAQATGVSAVRSNGCFFLWPSDTDGGLLSVSLRQGYEVRAARPWLDRVMAGKASYVDLPVLYNGGFVKTEVVDRIRAKGGTFYKSRIPDLYSAIALARTLDDYAYSHEPLAVNGASKHSNGTWAMRGGQRAGNNNPATVFLAEPNLPLHPDIPLCADGTYPLSLHVLTYESYLQSGFLDTADGNATSHREQLAIILDASGVNRGNAVEWAEGFARQHGLPFQAFYRNSLLRRPLMFAGSVARFLARQASNIRVDGNAVRMKDVHEASAVAAAVRASRPSIVMNNLAQLRRAIARRLAH